MPVGSARLARLYQVKRSSTSEARGRGLHHFEPHPRKLDLKIESLTFGGAVLLFLVDASTVVRRRQVVDLTRGTGSGNRVTEGSAECCKWVRLYRHRGIQGHGALMRNQKYPRATKNCCGRGIPRRSGEAARVAVRDPHQELLDNWVRSYRERGAESLPSLPP